MILMKDMNKGQFTMIGLMGVFLTLILAGAFFPTIQTTVDNMKACATSDVDLVLNLIPFMIPIAIIMSIVIYASATRDPYRQ